MGLRADFMPAGELPYAAILDKGLPVPVLKSKMGGRYLVGLFSLLIGGLAKSFNVSKNMNDEQIMDFSIELIDEFSFEGSHDVPAYRIEDFACFFELAKSGKYGRPFDYNNLNYLLTKIIK